MEDAELSQLLNQVESLFQGQNSFVQPSEVGNQNSTYQAPIKGTFYNSGNFSMTATDPRHPTGHMGVDMRASAGTSVYPMCAGIVSNVGSSSKGGNTVSIQHANNVRTYYAHLSTVKVQKGDRVDNNTVIGAVGDSGNAKGTFPHLHFQVWKDNQIQNPANYFSVPKYSALGKNEKFWVSDEAKQEAQAFHMNQHLQNRRVAFSREIGLLNKFADLYFRVGRL